MCRGECRLRLRVALPSASCSQRGLRYFSDSVRDEYAEGQLDAQVRLVSNNFAEGCSVFTNSFPKIGRRGFAVYEGAVDLRCQRIGATLFLSHLSSSSLLSFIFLNLHQILDLPIKSSTIPSKCKQGRRRAARRQPPLLVLVIFTSGYIAL